MIANNLIGGVVGHGYGLGRTASIQFDGEERSEITIDFDGEVVTI